MPSRTFRSGSAGPTASYCAPCWSKSAIRTCSSSSSLPNRSLPAVPSCRRPSSISIPSDPAESALHVRHVCRRRFQSIRACRGRSRGRAAVERPTTRSFSTAEWGMGKTHLMQAIGHALQDAQSRAAAHLHQRGKIHQRSDRLRMRFDRMAAFRDRFRSVDVLLVDDIQFIAAQGAHPGRVFSHLQRAVRPAEADRDLLRLPAEGNLRHRGAACARDSSGA